jgi:hypothetical protein
MSFERGIARSGLRLHPLATAPPSRRRLVGRIAHVGILEKALSEVQSSFGSDVSGFFIPFGGENKTEARRRKERAIWPHFAALRWTAQRKERAKRAFSGRSDERRLRAKRSCVFGTCRACLSGFAPHGRRPVRGDPALPPSLCSFCSVCLWVRFFLRFAPG